MQIEIESGFRFMDLAAGPYALTVYTTKGAIKFYDINESGGKKERLEHCFASVAV